MGLCKHVSMSTSQATLISAFLGLYPAHHRGVYLGRKRQLAPGCALTLGVPPGSHVCPAWALPRLMPQRGHPAPEGLWSLPGLLMAHEPELEADGLLDLSFLTEEEQEAIAEVLKRDACLRQLEEGRVR